VRAAEVLQDEDAVLPPEHAGHERAVDHLVDGVLVTQPVEGQLVGGGLDEHGAPVGELRDGADRVRVAASGGALGDDRRPGEALDRFPVHAA
jgi:hypothetical protein